jgi:hypothetical protein
MNRTINRFHRTTGQVRTIRRGLLLALLLASGPARAELGPPVSVHLLGEPRAAKAGEPISGELRIAAGAAGEMA